MVSFVGAGPGDVDLITVKGRKLLSEADVVIYAGSLVSKEQMKYCKSGCEIYNSASMTLDEVIDVFIKSDRAGKKVVRLHTGDPTIYGAIKEQMDELTKFGIEYEVIPGVSSFTASCARIKKEFTLPGVSQSIIITRLKGKTDVPEAEDLEKLASYKAAMAIFLSVQNIDEVVKKLICGYGSENVPVAVIYKATWKDEKIIHGTLKDIADKVKTEGIKSTAQILVGYFLNSNYEKSKLYDPAFSHKFRKA